MQLTFDPTNASEVEQVTSILTVLGPPATEPQAATVAPMRQSDTLDVAVFVENVGQESRRFVTEALRHFGPGVEFTFEQLAAKSGIPVSELKAWHRNLSRGALGGRPDHTGDRGRVEERPAALQDNARASGGSGQQLVAER